MILWAYRRNPVSEVSIIESTEWSHERVVIYQFWFAGKDNFRSGGRGQAKGGEGWLSVGGGGGGGQPTQIKIQPWHHEIVSSNQFRWIAHLDTSKV